MIYFLIDFDGTVCDSKEGVLKSARYAIEKLGVNFELPEKEMEIMFMGPPLTLPFGKIFSGDQEKVSLAIKYFRERYNVYGIMECCLYKGIAECLKNIKDAGVRLYIASSKPYGFIEQILGNNNAEGLFEKIYAPGFDAEKLSKYDIVKQALDEIQLYDKSSDVFMVGDRKYDIEGAHKAGIPCIGVTWGYSDKNEFEEYGADYIVENCGELYRLALELLSRQGKNDE